MNRFATPTLRASLPKALRKRLRPFRPNVRNEAERLLRDLAFVLQMTRRIRDEMENDTPPKA